MHVLSGHCKVRMHAQSASVSYLLKHVHLQNLAPVYEQLADAFAHKKDKVVVAKVDADGEGRPLGQTYGVTGFPST